MTETHPDIFTPEEAVVYLHLTNTRQLDRLREKGYLIGFDGIAAHLMYWREDLDRCAMRMFGRDPDKGKPKDVQLRFDNKPRRDRG